MNTIFLPLFLSSYFFLPFLLYFFLLPFSLPPYFLFMLYCSVLSPPVGFISFPQVLGFPEDLEPFPPHFIFLLAVHCLLGLLGTGQIFKAIDICALFNVILRSSSPFSSHALSQSFRSCTFTSEISVTFFF